MSGIDVPSLDEVIELKIRSELLAVHTSMPGEVQSFDASKQVADVKPLLKGRVFNDEGEYETVDLPVLSNVPVIFPSGGGFRGTFPLAAGDVVEVQFQEASIDRWQALGGSQPTDGRRFHIADAVCVVGLHDDKKPWSGVSTSKATWGKDGSPQLIATASGLELGATDTDAATEQVILGTAYRSAEEAMLTTLAAQLQSAGGALTGAAVPLAALSTALTALAAPAGSAVTALATFIATAASSLNAAAAGVTNFQSQASGQASFLSSKVKTK